MEKQEKEEQTKPDMKTALEQAEGSDQECDLDLGLSYDIWY